MDRARGQKKRTATLWAGPAGCAVLVCCFWYLGELSGGQHPQSPCLGNRLCAIVNTQLAIDAARMGLDRVHREDKPGGDFGVGQPLGDELEDF